MTNQKKTNQNKSNQKKKIQKTNNNDKIINDYKNDVLQSIKRASKEGVLLFKTEDPDHPATVEQIVEAPGVKEDFYYKLQFIVKDEEGNVTEMWFGDDKIKGKRSRGR